MVRTRHRLLALLAIVSAAMLIVAIGVLWLIDGAVRRQTIERLEAETALVADRVEDGDAARDPQRFAERVARALGVRTTLIDPEGRVVGDSSRSRASLAVMDNHLDRPEVRSARTLGASHVLRRSGTTNVEYHYSAHRVDGVDAIGYVRLAFPARSIEGVRAHHTEVVIGVAAIAAIALTTMAYGGVRKISRSVESMAAELEHAAEARRVPRVDAGADEIGVLAVAVQRTTARWLEAIAQLESDTAVLSSVVAGMREGVLLVGPDRRVRLANPALVKILEVGVDPVGKLLEEIVRHPPVLEGVESTLSDGVPVEGATVELADSQRTFELRVTPLDEEDDEYAALVLFFDVTRIEQLERVRRDFVADVSHELRTPLTSIKVATENLVEGVDDPETSRRFLDIIRRHVDRMGDLVDDLTDLSQIETGSVTLEVSRIDASRVARDVAEQLRPLADSRKVELSVAMPDGMSLQADRRRFEHMLENLVSNAIKFNHPGGEVVIEGDPSPDAPTVRVRDTGIGIPADSIDKVFQRFYRISRDRSRELGGTGLGLSIVKHLMRLHGGRVRVESEVGVGSTFVLEFPPEPAVEPARFPPPPA